MSWYIKQIFAQAVQTGGLIGYLESIGVNSDIIQYIVSQEKNITQFLINEIRKNPSLTLQQLQQIQIPQKIDPYLASEKRIAGRYESGLPQFSKWLLVSFRKLRKGILPESDNIFELNQVVGEGNALHYQTFTYAIPEIADWAAQVNPNISSYSPDQAMQASDEWHQMMAGQGEGKMYEATKQENIAYGPDWKNPKYNGWTIQKVISENDLLAEGNKMDHCVGSYCERVEEGFSKIYSLRDPQNKPHITMETDDFDRVEQIQGKSNSIPKSEYREMMKEWIQSPNNKDIYEYDGDVDPFSKVSVRYGTAEDILNAIEELKSDDYGLEKNTTLSPTEIMQMSIDIMNNMREPQYWGEHTSVPEAIIDMVFEIYKNDPEKILSEINNFEQSLYEQDVKIWDWGYSNWDMGSEDYPQEEDYETKEEFEGAEEEYKDNEADYMAEEVRKTPQGGFAHDGIKYINRLREKRVFPVSQEVKELETVGSLNSNWYKKSYRSNSELV